MQLAEAGGLAADLGDIGHAHVARAVERPLRLTQRPSDRRRSDGGAQDPVDVIGRLVDR